jgi:GH25 family lysozyme M1 (1,4-beta-N-acetylmuramidase)
LTTANVVDVSEWQPTSIDWANLKANGVKAVVVRIGHGVTRDEHAADHIANATKAGLIIHVYHYYEGVDGELQYSVNNAKSLNIQPNVYYFLDMEGTIAGSWPSIFESFRKRWAGYGWNTGLYCSLSNYAKFDNATLVKQGVYRWIAAWDSSQPSNADMWQYDSKTGLGSYTSALDKDADIAGKLVKEPDSTIVEQPTRTATTRSSLALSSGLTTVPLSYRVVRCWLPAQTGKIKFLSWHLRVLFCLTTLMGTICGR